MVKISLGKLKIPIIAGYIAGFITSMTQVILLQATEPIVFAGSPILQTPILPLLWPISWLAGTINPIFDFSAAIIVGILTWFALKK